MQQAAIQQAAVQQGAMSRTDIHRRGRELHAWLARDLRPQRVPRGRFVLPALAVVVVVLAGLSGGPVGAQQRGGSRNAPAAPTFGSRSTPTAGQSGLGGALGAQNGGTGLGSTGVGAGQSNQRLGQGMGMEGDQQFGGPTDGRQRGFIGRDAQDVRERFNSLSRGQRRRMMFDMMIENLNEMRLDRRRRERDNQPAPPANLQIVADVDVERPSATQAAATAAVHAQEGFRRRRIDGAAMSFEEGAVVLRGTVKNEYERQLAEQLVALEPGVAKVVNRLEVASPQQGPQEGPRLGQQH